ncbi:MAG: hypothetical protein KDD73_03030 [Anaerolineales bacterium]|nr:hypothetical protein [Anaerolineales bacterium]MCB9128181.1 hypothetical protein [Ardenticatenales bacterium]MCB9171890.1 hypothetical protein [Ardenticatenales bacterium]
MAVGQTIRQLRAASQAGTQRPVVVERAYWDYLAVIVGTNDIDQIIFDREVTAARDAPSLMLADPTAFAICLSRYEVSYVIVRDAELQNALESELALRPTQSVNDYVFYPVDLAELTRTPTDAPSACPWLDDLPK